jgi:predicted transglutaminase-like cysteine proteinase
MGGSLKKVASVATLGLSGAVLGDALDSPKTSSTSVNDVNNNTVSDADSANYAADKKRRAQAAGLSSTILGGAAATQSTGAGKTLLGM